MIEIINYLVIIAILLGFTAIVGIGVLFWYLH